jgi:hypothetical protein
MSALRAAFFFPFSEFGAVLCIQPAGTDFWFVQHRSRHLNVQFSL